MSSNTFLTRGKGAATRAFVAVAMVSAGAVIGLAGTAGAAAATHLVITGIPSTSDASGAPLGVQPEISLEDGSNAVDTGNTDTITASITTGGVSVSNATATAVSGVATFSGLALNALDGSYTLTFTDTTHGTITPTASASITVTTGTATQLVITTQPSAGDVSGAALPVQPVVKVEDSGGNVVTSVNSGAATASVFTGTPTITSGSSANFASGVATFSTLTLTGATGAAATLKFAGDSLTSAATNAITMSTAANKLAISTVPSVTALSGVALTIQPVVIIEDGSNNRDYADGSTVTASVTGAGGTVTSATAIAVNGLATFSGLAINALSGSYTLTFTDGSLTSAQSASITVSPGPAAKLIITTEPSASVAAGAALSQQPVIKVEDSGGNLVTSNASTVTATLTSGSGTITNPNATAVGGIATFSGLAINSPAGLYTLTFSDGALTTAISSSITVNSGAAAKLVIVTEPSSTVASGAVLAVQPVVKVEDSGGNVITGSPSTVTATVTSGGSAAVSNTASVNTSTGLASFSGLALNSLVGTYTLTFSDGALTTAVSTGITVTPGTAAKLVITTQPATVDASGSALSPQPVVKVEDAAGNVVTTDISTVTAKITTGGVSVSSPTAVATAGVATFSSTALNALVGAYTLTFTDGSLTSAVSTTITVTVGTASKLVVSTEPSSQAASGTALATQPVVKVVDSGGNLVTTVNTGSVTAAIYTGAGGAVSAGGTAAFNAGVASFSGLTLTGVQGTSYTLAFSGDSLIVDDATSITVGTLQATLKVTSLSAVFGRTLNLTTAGGSGTGAVTYAVTNGTATGCSVSGATLSYSSTGTCMVTATKAADSTYLSTSSVATAVTVAKLPRPGAVRINFKSNSSALSTAARNALISLSKKLTKHSSVTITGYANGNLALAKRRASAVGQYLEGRVKAHLRYVWSTHTSLQSARLVTTAQ